MKNIILQILRETVSENEQIESCRSNETTNEFLRGFNLWRTGMCNEDTFKTPERINQLVSQNFKNNITSIKLDNGTVITKEQYIKKLQDEYEERITMCVVPYVGERVKSENACNEILNEYNKPEIRTAFNRYMKFPSNCYVFNIESCDEYKPMKSKEITQLPTTQTTTLAKSTTTVKIPEPPQDKTRIQQIINKIIKQIKNRFGN